MTAAALLFAVPAVLALAAVVALLPQQHARTALNAALGLWIAALFLVLPLLLLRS